MGQDHPPLPPSPKRRPSPGLPAAGDREYGPGKGYDQARKLADRASKAKATIRPERSTDTMGLQDFDRAYGIENRRLQDIRAREMGGVQRDMEAGRDPYDTVRPLKRRATTRSVRSKR